MSSRAGNSDQLRRLARKGQSGCGRCCPPKSQR